MYPPEISLYGSSSERRVEIAGSSSHSEHHDFGEITSRVDWVLVFLGFPRYRALPGNGRKIENPQNQVLFSWFFRLQKLKTFCS